MHFKINTQGRPGKRSSSQQLQEDLRRASRLNDDAYSLGGRLKEGRHAPRPITLPKLKFMEGPDPSEE